MSILRLISRRQILIIFFGAAFFALLPYPYIYAKLGYHMPIIPVAAYTGEGGEYYLMRIQEIKDGYPFIGNPFFIEHRNEISTAFFFSDWFGAIPLLLGATIMFSTIFNLFIWSFLFILLAFLLFRLLYLSPKWSMFGAFFGYAGVYGLMLRPVSMQVIFPFFLAFLVAFLMWLKDTQNSKKQFLLAFVAALVAYIYTYAWQIVIVSLLLTPIYFFFIKDKRSLKAFFRVFILFAALSLPLVLYSIQQVEHPFYFETMQRIGLISTHLPTAAVVKVSAWIFVIFIFWVFLFTKQRALFAEHGRATSFLFFVFTGLAMVAVMFSTVITGKDLELPQHIERFVIFWFAVSSVYTCWLLLHSKELPKISLPAFVFGTILVAVICFGNIRYLINGGPGIVFDPSYDFAFYQKVQGFDAPLSWLRDNVKEPAVVWGDPQGRINDYVVTLTQHYVLFKAAGVLHLASNQELEERYLVSHYFSLTETGLEDGYWDYGGVGNAIHGWKTENRKVRLCNILHLDRLGYQCGQMTDLVSWKGKTYFTGLYNEYLDHIRPDIKSELMKYHVSYAIRDVETDTPDFHPETLPWVKQVYTDGRFTIYKLEFETR